MTLKTFKFKTQLPDGSILCATHPLPSRNTLTLLLKYGTESSWYVWVDSPTGIPLTEIHECDTTPQALKVAERLMKGY